MVKTGQRVQAARLPQRSGGGAGDRLKGLVSLVAIVAIVGGVPYVLVRFFGTPWPDQMPNRDVLFSELSAETIIGIITFFVWLAWLHFVICLIVEAVVGAARSWPVTTDSARWRFADAGPSADLRRRPARRCRQRDAAGRERGHHLPVAGPTSVTCRPERRATARATSFRATEPRSTVQLGAPSGEAHAHRRTDEQRPLGSGRQVHRGQAAAGPQLRLPVGHRRALPGRGPAVQGDLRPQQEQAAAGRPPADQPGPDHAGLAGAPAGRRQGRRACTRCGSTSISPTTSHERQAGQDRQASRPEADTNRPEVARTGRAKPDRRGGPRPGTRWFEQGRQSPAPSVTIGGVAGDPGAKNASRATDRRRHRPTSRVRRSPSRATRSRVALEVPEATVPVVVDQSGFDADAGRDLRIRWHLARGRSRAGAEAPPRLGAWAPDRRRPATGRPRSTCGWPPTIPTAQFVDNSLRGSVR